MKLVGTNPFSGDKVNVLSPSAITEGMVGIGYLAVIAAGGYYLYRKIAQYTAGTPLAQVTTLPVRSTGVPVKLRVVHGL